MRTAAGANNKNHKGTSAPKAALAVCWKAVQTVIPSEARNLAPIRSGLRNEIPRFARNDSVHKPLIFNQQDKYVVNSSRLREFVREIRQTLRLAGEISTFAW